MFDCVVVAGCRFIVCIAFFALADLNHWWPVVLTTVSTTVFVAAKVFEYQWTNYGPITFDVMLVLLTFILAWGELWFLDFRVLPLEGKAREIAETIEGSIGGAGQGERAPLLGGVGSVLSRYMEGSLWAGSVGDFYSPLESPEDLGDEDEYEEGSHVRVPRKFRRKTPLSEAVSVLNICLYYFNLTITYPRRFLPKRPKDFGLGCMNKILHT